MEVKDFPLVGRAAVAVQNFEINEVVMIEHPLMVLPKVRQDTPLFDKLDDIADRYRLQMGMLYPVIYYTKASADIKEKVHEFFAPKLEPGTVQHSRYYGAANEMVKLPEFEGVEAEAIVTFLLILRINVHMVGDGTKMSALFYMGSKVTHSCDPNCMALALGTKLSYRAIRPIAKGDLITFSYISGFDLWKSTAARRTMIRDTRFFTCVCSRCIGPDTTRMLKCAKCGGQKVLYFLPGQEGFLGKDPNPPTDTPWTCQNPECNAKFKDEEMPLEMESKFEFQVLDTYFSNSKRDEPVTFEYTLGMLQACDQVLGSNHWLSAMMVYTLMAVHHNSLNRKEKPVSTGRDVVMWADRLARWMALTMPGSMPQAVISKFAGQTCEVYGVNSLAAAYYAQCVPLLRVHYGERHKEILDMTEFVQKHGNEKLIAAMDPKTFSPATVSAITTYVEPVQFVNASAPKPKANDSEANSNENGEDKKEEEAEETKSSKAEGPGQKQRKNGNHNKQAKGRAN